VDPLEAIRRAQEQDLVDEDGDPVELELEPPLPEAEIDGLERDLGVPLPRELRALLAHTAGIEGSALDAIDFTGRRLAFEMPELFPSGVPIGADGFGNFWVLDLTPDGEERAPVFFAAHDPPVVLYQAPGIGEFLHETFRMSVPPHESLVDDVHEDRLFGVWRENPGTLDHAAALAAADEELRAFAAELDERFVFVDLRSPEVGMGVSWGRHGPQTEVRRHGHRRLFAYAGPEKKPGLLRRLLG
jgi:hypothetical protein